MTEPNLEDLREQFEKEFPYLDFHKTKDGDYSEAETGHTWIGFACGYALGHPDKHDCAKDDRKLPIDRPCSACSGGDPKMKHHLHCPPFRGHPDKLRIDTKQLAISILANFAYKYVHADQFGHPQSVIDAAINRATREIEAALGEQGGQSPQVTKDADFYKGYFEGARAALAEAELRREHTPLESKAEEAEDNNCSNCGHMEVEHNGPGHQCWNGSGVGNKRPCTAYERE